MLSRKSGPPMKRAFRTAALTGTAVGAAGVLASLLGPVLAFEEAAGLDVLFTLRGPRTPPAEVIVIAIDSESAQYFDVAEALAEARDLTGWPRSLHARLLEALEPFGPAATAFDIHFKDPQNEVDDALFEAAILGAGNVILYDYIEQVVELPPVDAPSRGVTIYHSRVVGPHRRFAGAALATAPFPLPDQPIRTNQYWTFVPTAYDSPSLPVVAFAARAAEAERTVVELLRAARPGLGDELASLGIAERLRALRYALIDDPDLAEAARENLPGAAADSRVMADALMLLDLLTNNEARYINFYGRPRTITTVPVQEILDDDGPDPAIPWRDAILLVGYSDRTQPAQDDAFYSVFSEQSGLRLSGVEIAATALANLIENRVLEPVPPVLHLAAVVIAGLLFGACFLIRSIGASIVTLGLAVAAYVTFVGLQFDLASTWWPLVVPVLMQAPLALVIGLALRYSRAAGQHAAIERGASRYLPAELVARMAENPDAASRSSEVVEGICLVTDIEGFTAYSETMDPKQLEVVLNAYYDVLFGIIDDNAGLVTDIVGDSMVAVWRSPGIVEASVSPPVRAALAIRDRLTDERASFPRTRVGLRAGRFLLGTVGAREHLEFRAVGDIVNTASRIQTLNKRLGTIVLAAQDAMPETGVISRDIGVFQLAGTQRPLVIVEPMALDNAPHARARALITRFSQALEAFRDNDLERAASLFDAVAADFDDGPSRFYRELIQSRLAGAAGSDPDPLIRLTD